MKDAAHVRYDGSELISAVLIDRAKKDHTIVWEGCYPESIETLELEKSSLKYLANR